MYFRELGLSEKFVKEVLEPIVRGRFGRDIEGVNGLEALLTVRDLMGKVVVKGGNWKIVNRLVKLGESNVDSGMRVRRIERGEERRLRVFGEDMRGGIEKLVGEEFDAVIIAAPVHLIKKDDGFVFELLPASKKHVTVFAYDGQLAPTFFNLSSDSKIPDTIFTTANASLESSIRSISKIDSVHYLDIERCILLDLKELWDCDIMI